MADRLYPNLWAADLPAHAACSQKNTAACAGSLERYQRTVDAFQCGAARECHNKLKLYAQHLQHAIDSCGAFCGEPPEHRSANENGARTQCQRFDNISATSYATIEIDFAASGYSCDDLWQRGDAGNSSIELATAVIGDNDPVETMLDCQQRILGGQHPLDQDRERGQGTQPGNVFPGEGGLEPGDVVDLEVSNAMGWRWQDQAVADITFATCKTWCIYGEHNGAIARLLGSLDEIRGNAVIVVDVELEPEWTTRCLCNLFDAAIGHCRDSHERIGLTRATGRLAFPFRVREAMTGCWRDQDGHGDRCAKHGGVGAACTDIHEHTWAQLDTLEGATIDAQCYLVVATAHIVVPEDRLNAFPGQCFVIAYIHGFHRLFLCCFSTICTCLCC